MDIAIARQAVATVAGFLLLLTSWAPAQEWVVTQDGFESEDKAWAREMFDATSFDFGTVARGAKAEHRFTIENIYEEEMQIVSVESSCKCTLAKVTKQLLKKFEKAELVATIDTRSEPGAKDATIRVRFGGQFFAVVQVHTHVYIRGDIVVQPEAVQFGTIAQGVAMQQTAAISYAPGRVDWQILKVECANPHITAHVAETGRTPARVNYTLTVILKADTPPGYVRDQVVLVTNDLNPRSSRIPVPVEGKIESVLSASPRQLLMGTVEVGKAVTQNIVLKGKTPFHVRSVKSNDDRFTFQTNDEAKAVHIIPVTFQVTETDTAAGPVSTKIRIETDLPGSAVVEVAASVRVVAASATKP